MGTHDTPATWGRRRVLQMMVWGALGAGSAPALAACGSSPRGGKAPALAADLSSTEKVVQFDNWPLYIDTDDTTKRHETLDLFTEKTGISVEYREVIEDDDAWFAKVAPQISQQTDIHTDLMVASDYIIPRYTRAGLLAAVDWDNVPNKANLNPALADPVYDPGRTYSIPWQSGMTLIGYNRTMVDKPLGTFDDLFRSDVAGNVLLMSSMPDTMSALLASMGKDPSAFSDDDFDAAIGKLKDLVDGGKVTRFAGQDYLAELAQGRAAASLVWSGDVLQLQLDKPDIQWVLPEEGAYLWSGNLVVPATARHRANAERLIDWVYQPDNAARIADWVQYICPVPAAQDVVRATDPDTADNKLVFPDDQMLSRTYQWKALTEDEETRYNQKFTAIADA